MNLLTTRARAAPDETVAPSRLLLLAAALLCVAPALPPRAPDPAPVASPPEAAATTAALHPGTLAAGPGPAAPGPAPADVDPLRAAVRVDAAPPDAVERVLDLEGVAHATAIHVGRLTVHGGDHLDVAAVDGEAFRPFTPPVVADEPGVWARLDEGALAVTHEHAERLGLSLGADVTFGDVPVRVGAFASNGLPPVAHAIVDVSTADELGLDGVVPTLLVAVEEQVAPDAVADAIEGALGVEATIVPDPRAPRPAAPAPPRGDTLWDLLAACESSGDWHADTGNGFYGGLQFLPESWWLVGGSGLPHEATREEQIARAERLLALQGWEAWPVCSIRMGLREGPAAG